MSVVAGAIERYTAFLGEHMDKSTGMFPAKWRCTRCDKVLNADGGHPAELYAGTYSGLCYACTGAPGFVVEELPDGCQVWSYPPHCPSWRRDRERALGFPDCLMCSGSGRLSHGSWTSAPRHCTECLDRHTGRGAYDTRSFFSRELSRAEAELRTYVAEMGREPSVIDPNADPAGAAQWSYTGKGTKKAREAAVLALARTLV